MIECICGVPGGGKSYWGVRRMMFYIASGGLVVSNVRLAGTVATGDTGLNKYDLAPDSHVRVWLREVLGWEYQQHQYIYIDEEDFKGDWVSGLPRGSPDKKVFLLLDEVNDIFDSLDTGELKGKTASAVAYRRLFEFVRMHRHYFVDCVFLLQSFPTLNARIRDLVQYVHKSVDMQGLRLAGIPFKSPFPVFVHFTFDRAGKNLLHKEYVTKEKGIFGLYESYCAHGNIQLVDAPFSVNFGNRGKINKKGTKKMNWFDRALLVSCFVVLGVILGCRGRGPGASGSVLLPGSPQVFRVVVTNTVQTVSDVSTVRPYRPSTVVEYAPISYHCGQVNGSGDTWAYAGGRMFRLGMQLAEGRVVQIETWGIRIIGEEGEKWIYHSDNSEVDSGNRASSQNVETRGKRAVINPNGIN